MNLLDRIRLGQNALIGGLDTGLGHLPYYNCGFNNGDVTQFCHSHPSDLHHNVARAVLALSMTQDVTGDQIHPTVLKDLTESLFSLFHEKDDLPGTPGGNGQERVIPLHNLREVILAMTELIKLGEERAEYWTRRLVRKLRQALDETGQIHLELLPPYVKGYTSQPHQEGRSIGALVEYYRVTGDEVALETSVLIANYTLKNCFDAHSSLTERAGHHTHSINGTVAGILDLALEINDYRLLQRAKLAYDVGVSSLTSSFGWCRERVDIFNEKGEGNSTGDYIRGALLLGRAGFPEYFDRAERALRSHLLPSQITDVDGFSDTPNTKNDSFHMVASRVQGGFGFRTPNDLIVWGYINPWMGYEGIPLCGQANLFRSTKNSVLIEDADLLSRNDSDRVISIYDVTSSAVEGLTAAWHSAITNDAVGVRVNLLFSGEAYGVHVNSYLPGEGRIDIKNASAQNVFVRIPEWVNSSNVTVKIEDQTCPTKMVGSYLLASGDERTQVTSIHFPVREKRTTESISLTEYTIDWLGDQILAMSPQAEHLPMFPPCK
jgi:hypothetical protein